MRTGLCENGVCHRAVHPATRGERGYPKRTPIDPPGGRALGDGARPRRPGTDQPQCPHPNPEGRPHRRARVPTHVDLG